MILRNSLVLLCRGVWWAGGGLKALLWKVFFLLNEVTNKPDRKKCLNKGTRLEYTLERGREEGMY